MKKLLFRVIFLLFFSQVTSQNQNEISVDSMLIDIDKTPFTSQILYDRTSKIARLDRFNDSINISNSRHFEQAILELSKGSKEQKFIPLNDLRSRYVSPKIQNKVGIGIINVKFHSINYKDYNESEGALRISNLKFEDLNNGNSTFISNQALVIAPQKLFLKGEYVEYYFSENLFFEDTDLEIVNLTANFNTNNDYNIINRGVLSTGNIRIEYRDSGKKSLRFTAEMSDGSVLTTYSTIDFKYERIQAPNPQIKDDSINATISFRGFNESVGVLGKLKYRTFFGNNQNRLLKPIVIIDGFDPGDKRQIQDSDPHPYATDEDHLSIVEMMFYTNSNNERIDLIDLLNLRGYDVVIVNHPNYFRETGAGIIEIDGGADYIERNAMTHVELYKKLNAELIQNNSSEELVIVGPSMGGQISRYALAYMEKEGISHNTRLWVSIDSPHLGANIPLGLQTLLHVINDNTDSVEAKDFVEKQLGSPAARQQLIEQYSGATNNVLHPNYFDAKTISQGYLTDKGRPIFINYYNSLFNNGLPGSKGYPQNLRKIAIVNGSLTNTRGFRNPFGPNSTEYSGSTTGDNFSHHGAQTLKIEGEIDFLGHAVTLESYFLPSTNSNHKIAFYKFKQGFWRYFDRYVSNYNSRGNLDNVPGGWFPSQRDLAKSVVSATPCVGPFCINDWNIANLKHVSSFIPTVSALGFNDPKFNWNRKFDRNLVCTGEIPFDSYFGPKLNEQHSSFSEASVQWFLKELEGIPQQPTFYLDEDDLNGSDTICSGAPELYNFDYCKTPIIDNWEVSNNLQIVSSNETSALIEMANSNSSGPGYIKAAYGDHIIEKNVWVGNPTLAPPIVAFTQNFPNSPTEYMFELDNNVNTIQGTVVEKEWNILPATMIQVMTNEDLWIETPEEVGVFLDYNFRFKNECGWSPWNTVHGETINGTSNGNHQNVQIYPNATDDKLFVDLTGVTNNSYNIKLYDNYASLVYEANCTNILKEITTQFLNEGHYYLHINDGNELIIKHVLVDH